MVGNMCFKVYISQSKICEFKNLTSQKMLTIKWKSYFCSCSAYLLMLKDVPTPKIICVLTKRQTETRIGR